MTLKRMLARAGALGFLLMVFAMHVFAQSRTVTGKVTDSRDGTPVANASVTIKGTNLGTTTDAGGNFRLAVPDNNAVLVISSVSSVTGVLNILFIFGCINQIPIGKKNNPNKRAVYSVELPYSFFSITWIE